MTSVVPRYDTRWECRDELLLLLSLVVCGVVCGALLLLLLDWLLAWLEGGSGLLDLGRCGFLLFLLLPLFPPSPFPSAASA